MKKSIDDDDDDDDFGRARAGATTSLEGSDAFAAASATNHWWKTSRPISAGWFGTARGRCATPAMLVTVASTTSEETSRSQPGAPGSDAGSGMPCDDWSLSPEIMKAGDEAGASVTLDDVLLMGEGSELKSTSGLTVAAEIIAQAKGEKVIVFKKRRRHNYRRRNGHRQNHTILKIVSVG